VVDKVTKPPITKKRTYRKIVSQITECEHKDAQFYSKGLCKNCYHKRGRVKLATGCQHKERKLYARFVCKGCYLRIYHRGNKNKDPEEVEEKKE
jgi:hypothetical protein